MAIRYVDIEPDEGKAKPRAPKPASGAGSEPVSERAAEPADEAPAAAPAPKAKRRKK